MIRFRCPSCDREYVLADALAHLPLLCKGCGQRLAVPDAGTGAAPEPDPEPEPPPKPKPAPPPTRQEPVEEPASEPKPPPPEMPPAPPPVRGRNALVWAADAVVFLVLLVLGGVVGEMVAQKPTREVLSGAASAPKFPPTDLILWLGCVAVFGLTYVWLGTRGWTVGGWLRRRAA